MAGAWENIQSPIEEATIAGAASGSTSLYIPSNPIPHKLVLCFHYSRWLQRRLRAYVLYIHWPSIATRQLGGFFCSPLRTRLRTLLPSSNGTVFFVFETFPRYLLTIDGAQASIQKVVS